MISILKKAKWDIPWWGYWLFFFIYGFLLLAFEDDYKDQDSYAIAILLYFFLLFLVVARWVFNQVKQVYHLKNEKAKTELMHLQNQVNPHFFFNTLNNLYGWVEKDSKQAKKMILKLSDMMRYSIYDGQKEFVTIEEEVQYLKNYIELHRMRYLKKIDISFEVNIEDMSYPVRPLLFIILLENAFKHGVENLRENAFVKLNLSIQNDELNFSIENNFDQEEDKKEIGIGLKNLKRRLELVYPKKHKLELLAKADIYSAHLTLNLK